MNKMNKSKLLLSLLLALVAGSVWAADEVTQVTYRQILTFNATNVNQVTTGMTTAEVVSLMKNYQSEVRDGMLSNPWKIESVGDTAVYHYLTRKNPPFTPIAEQQATPVIFKNGKVTAVGRGYLKAARNDAVSSAPTPTPSTPASKGTLEERLNKLKGLFESGAIDQKTYEAQQQKILDEI